MLQRYSMVIIDDCHDRSVNTDLALGLLKKIQRKRKDLKIIISSATIDVSLYQRFWQNKTSLDEVKVNVVYVEGRSFPVELFYLEQATRDYTR